MLGQATAGPANIRLSVEQAWASIHQALAELINKLGLSFTDTQQQFHVGMGLSGCEVIEAYQTFIQRPHPFSTLAVTSDAETACLGAHAGDDGMVVIAGTGTIALQRRSQHWHKVGGWGFPHDDEGSGAWLGLYAIKSTLQWLDGRLPVSLLAQKVYDHFQDNSQRLVTWANQANSTAFASLAPLVIDAAFAGDSTAVALLQQAATAVERLVQALDAQSRRPALPCCLMGGIAPFLQAYLSITLQQRLRPCLASADVGAIFFIRQQLQLNPPKE